MAKINREKLTLALFLLFYCVIQFFTLGRRGLDGDEGVILKVALADNWQAFWTFIAHDVHPPLYHLLARTSMNLFGVYEWSLRLPAALAGALLIPLGYALGRVVFKKKSLALLLAGLFTLSPYLFYFYGEARFYSLLLLGATLTYIAIFRMQSEKGIYWWLLFLAGALIMVWAQYLGWFILLAEFGTLVAVRQWREVKKTGIALALVGLSYVSFCRIALVQISGRLTEQGGLALGDNIKGLLGALYRFGTGRLVLGIEPSTLLVGGWGYILLFMISLIVPALIILAPWRRQKKCILVSRKNLSIILAVSAVSFVMALLVSEVGGRATRYMVYLWPFYGIFIVLGVTSLWHKVWGKIIVASFFILMLAGLGKHVFSCNQAVGAREIAMLLAHKVEAQDAILTKGAFAGGESAALRFYLKKDVTILDYFSDYKPGALKSKTLTTELFINQALEAHAVVWYYDFTYGNFKKEEINGSIAENFIGKDKEEKEIVLYKITKQQGV